MWLCLCATQKLQLRFIFLALGVYYWEQDPAFKAKFKEIAFQKLPFYLDKFEAQIKNNGEYFVNGKVWLSIACQTTDAFLLILPLQRSKNTFLLF